MAAPTVVATRAGATRAGYVTLDAFYQMDDLPEWGAELADGEVVMTPPPSFDHGLCTRALFRALDAYVVGHEMGDVFGDGFGYELPIAGRPDTYRTPDVSFVRAGRIPRARVRHRALALAPDLAVEIRSRSDTAAVLERKLADYLEAGTALVWVVDGDARTVAIHTAGSTVRILGGSEALDGGAVLPGFQLPLADLFAALD
ncbi:MAG TPA: Uma2 family endonuclease [Gemmatirosa sp.]